jgi:galactose mutarotase-like enzyme
MYSIENQVLRVLIAPKGAELQSIFNKEFQLEYLWGGDPVFWSKKSPVLFPIVGSLKNDTYYYQGHEYHLSRHGFSRDMLFDIAARQFDRIELLLRSSEQTQVLFPFSFEFRVKYRLDANKLETTYEVTNTGSGPMYFSVGGHPAFKVPLVDRLAYGDYFLEFNEEETLPRWPISPQGLIEKTPQPLMRQTNRLQLTKELFYQDAIVFKFPTSSILTLQSDKSDHGLDILFDGFPYLGIWAAKQADFVCLEPWCGIADSVDCDQQLFHKEGINQLAPRGVFQRSWTVTLF